MISLCPDFKNCGSCPLSDLAYPEQLIQKRTRVNEVFSNLGLALQIDSLEPSPITTHYRNRMDFCIGFDGAFGLKSKGKWWHVLDGHHCFISMPSIEKVFRVIKEWLPSCEVSFYDRRRHAGMLRYAVIKATKAGEVLVSIVTSAPQNHEETARINAALVSLGQSESITSLVWLINDTDSDTSYGSVALVVKGSGYLVETIGDFRYIISPNSFFQTNPYVAEQLQTHVLGLVETNIPTQVDFLDLYCGSGFFTIPISQKVANVIGVELVQESLDDAKINQELNSGKALFIKSKVEDALFSIKEKNAVLVDPSRAGLGDKVLRALLKERPDYLIYVSCNYKAFAQELKALSKSYSVISSNAFDMFPHTEHLEMVTLLKLNPALDTSMIL